MYCCLTLRDLRGGHAVALDLVDFRQQRLLHLLVRGAGRERRVQGVQRQIVVQIGARARVQGEPLIDERAIQARVLARTQDGIEHLERRLIRIAAVRHLVRDRPRCPVRPGV